MGTKITALGAIPEVANVDVLPIVDLTDTTTKKATITQIEARFTADGFLSALDNISELTNDSGFITASDFSNDGENAGVDRDLGNLDAFALSFITSGVGRINIEAGGNVGIGTSTPTETLEVVGNTITGKAVIGSNSFVATEVLRTLGEVRMEGNARIHATSTGTQYLFKVRDFANLELINITEDKKLTINTDTGTRVGFNVAAVSNTVVNTKGETGVDKVLRVIDNSSSNIFEVWNNKDIFIDSASGTEIGIGRPRTTDTFMDFKPGEAAKSQMRLRHGVAPSSPINGDMWTTTAGLFVRINGVTVGALSKGIYAGSGSLSADTTVTNAGFDLSILGTGNFGIGTAAPTEKLEIAGNVLLNTASNRMTIGSALDSATGLFVETNGTHAIKTQNVGGTRKGLSVTNSDGRVGVGWDSAGPYKFIVVNDHSATSIARFYDNGASNLVLDIAETGQVKIGGTVSNANAILDIKNTTKALHLPTLSTTTRDGLTVGASDAGLLILNDTTKKLNFYNGTAWEVVTSV